MRVPGWVGLVLALVTGAVAFVVRLVPVLRGGGLAGIGNYDDGVYYVAGTALRHGLLPYRDFVFLHPPGVILATAPFALLADVAGDPTGLSAARLSWMLIGAINCVLVARIVYPLGVLPAALGALVYAFSAAAIYTEWTTLLVAPAQMCVLLAILLLGWTDDDSQPVTLLALSAGALLGASATFKIWGAAAVFAVVIWLLICREWRRTLLVLGGAAAAITAICLPFFVAAPGRMWLMVVEAQVGRAPSQTPAATRLAGILGLNLEAPRITSFTPALVLVLLLALGLLVCAAWVPEARLPLALTAVMTAVLLVGPSWFLHYPGFVTGPLAVSLACGASQLILWAAEPHRWLGLVVAVALALPIGFQAYRQRDLNLGTRFPGPEFAVRAADTPGCVTADDQTILAGMNVLTRNLNRQCPFVADFSGYSYVFNAERGRAVARNRDPRWQAMYLGYLESGTYALAWRYPRSGALSKATMDTVTGWPRVQRIDRFSLRDPHAR